MESWQLNREALRDRVAVVAGATRGAGRGIAAALGEAGATAYCTGRSSRGRTLQSDYDRPETIEETAELVTSLGGNGIPVAIDHLAPDQVEGLSKRIRDEHGHIDVLVNDIWGAEILSKVDHRTGTNPSGKLTCTKGSGLFAWRSIRT